MIKSFKQHIATEKAQSSLKKRYKKESNFVNLGRIAIIISLSFLAILISVIAFKARGIFFSYEIKLEINLDQKTIDPRNTNDIEIIRRANFTKLIRNSLKNEFPEITSRSDKKRLYNFVSKDLQINLMDEVIKNPKLIGQKIVIWGKVSSIVEQYLKGNISETDSEKVNITNFEKDLLKKLKAQNKIKRKFNSSYFINGNSTEPERAGVATALIGSFFTMFVFLIVSVPFAVLTAVYLEEFAKKSRLTDLIEININNLAAIPSVIYGLLGLALFINFLDVPRSSALVGGLTLSMLVLPIIIISTRNSIKSVPLSLKQAALALGASPLQVVFHHTLPLATPGIMTGVILAIARAIGETAPLFMVGMIAFIVDVPKSITSPTTVLPAQIYLWSNEPAIGFVEIVSATILLLIVLLISINFLAIIIREKFSTKI